MNLIKFSFVLGLILTSKNAMADCQAGGTISTERFGSSVITTCTYRAADGKIYSETFGDPRFLPGFMQMELDVNRRNCNDGRVLTPTVEYNGASSGQYNLSFDSCGSSGEGKKSVHLSLKAASGETVAETMTEYSAPVTEIPAVRTIEAIRNSSAVFQDTVIRAINSNIALESEQPDFLEISRFDREGTRNEVINFYRSFLKREPEAGAADWWTSLVEAGYLTLAQVEASIHKSPESIYKQVDQLYRALLNRAPSGAEVEWQAGFVIRGQLTIDQLRMNFINSAEYRLSH